MTYSTKHKLYLTIFSYITILILSPLNLLSENLIEPLHEKNEVQSPAEDEESLKLTVFGTLYTEKNEGDEITIKVYDLNDASVFDIDDPDDFTINLDFDKEYQIEFKQTGYLSKKIIIDTNVPEGISREFPSFNISVTLIKEDQELTDLIPLTAGKIFYDAETDNFNAKILNDSTE